MHYLLNNSIYTDNKVSLMISMVTQVNRHGEEVHKKLVYYYL